MYMIKNIFVYLLFIFELKSAFICMYNGFIAFNYFNCREYKLRNN